MGRYGITLDEMTEGTRSYFRKQRELQERRRNKPMESKVVLSNQQPQQLPAQTVSINPQGENPSPTNISHYPRNNQPKDFDAGLFLILTTITGVFLYLFSADARLMAHQLIEKGIGRLNLLSQESLMMAGIVVIVCIIALISRKK